MTLDKEAGGFEKDYARFWAKKDAKPRS